MNLNDKTVNTLNLFSKLSGLKLNYENLKVIWMGWRRNSIKRFYKNLNPKWNPKSFKVLVIVFSTDHSKMIKLVTAHVCRADSEQAVTAHVCRAHSEQAVTSHVCHRRYLN